jgi:hypothetical protein
LKGKGEIMATIYGPTTDIPFGLCSECGDVTYHCWKCGRHPCPNCSPLVDTPWGETCPFCGNYMNVYYDPPEGMSREEWEKGFKERLPEDYELYMRNKPREERKETDAA